MKKTSRIIILLLLSLLLVPWAGFCAVAYAKSEVPFYLAGTDPVYITRTGHCYHTTDHCSTTKVAYELSRAEAYRLGFSPCSNCEPELPFLLADLTFELPIDEPIVYYMVQDNYYHTSDDCGDIEQNDYGNVPVAITLDEAQYLEKKPCTRCHPAK